MRFHELPRVGDVVVDLPALLELEHRCDPALCGDSPCCGAGYEVCLGEDELPAVVGAMALARRYARRLHTREGENPFEELLPGLYRLDVAEDGRCLFAYVAGGGELLCSLHTAALANELEVSSVKPRSCRLWPLASSGSTPGYLGVDPGAYRFPCNRRRKTHQKTLDPGVAAIMGDVFGAEFRCEVEKLVADLATQAALDR